ncbi:DUF922 domain-containing protein [Fulvivirgaceae bacterium BMA12]|uniref:DUF922 domain-containing protein n=1 Tax=Agaribacillus aureus TaxID=3051825 RepID=A0ABT8LHD8_9BACT|nr:DUF922 domain-containing protein [Fulvivirgaceae bacterium BMA12]
MARVKIFLFTCIQLAMTSGVAAQEARQAVDFTVYQKWQKFDPLDWEDFKGAKPDEYQGDAGSVVKIKAIPFIVKKKIQYKVYALFNRKKSWAQKRSSKLLKHEQLHFDIAELYARKIRKKIAWLSNAGEDDLKVYNREIETLMQESNDFDRLYDAKTLHGALLRQQLVWEEKVSRSLRDLEGFKEKKNIIRRK